MRNIIFGRKGEIVPSNTNVDQIYMPASSTPTEFYLEIYGCSRVPHTLAACKSGRGDLAICGEHPFGVACMPSLEQPFFQTALA